jgi:hypothetical protein
LSQRGTRCVGFADETSLRSDAPRQQTSASGSLDLVVFMREQANLIRPSGALHATPPQIRRSPRCQRPIRTEPARRSDFVIDTKLMLTSLRQIHLLAATVVGASSIRTLCSLTIFKRKGIDRRRTFHRNFASSENRLVRGPLDARNRRRTRPPDRQRASAPLRRRSGFQGHQLLFTLQTCICA